ncbi:MAG: TIGR02757 family protein [Balneolaceae bacterium]
MHKPLRRHSHNKLLELKPLLDGISREVESAGYIRNDPVQFMHAFESKRDMEIAGFLAALMAWGRRDVVIRKTEGLLKRMGYSPYTYVINYSPSDADDFRTFRHRTFNQTDIHGLISALQAVYLSFDDFEEFWKTCYKQSMDEKRTLLSVFHSRFLTISGELDARTWKHVSSPDNNSACKRLTMFLRWACRKGSPVDTGIWDFLSPSQLFIPLDVHIARQSRRLGLLTRRSNDWKAVEELTEIFRLMSPADPSVYDFALFGLGALGYSLPHRYFLNPV